MIGLTAAQKRAILVVLPLVLLAGGFVVASVFPSASNQGYQPDQPIPFSHRLHAGDNKIDCQYCHSAAEKSRHATVPALNVCMNCHRVVKTDSPWIQKITEAYEAGRPIEWVRIHELPDFVNFPHKVHVQHEVSCQTCHGPVETMDKVYQHASLTMGWCLDCHKGDTAPSNVMRLVEKEQREGKDRWKTPNGPVGPRDCSACHQ